MAVRFQHPAAVAASLQMKREIITQPWYDTQNVPATTSWNTDIIFFANPNTPSRHVVLTNMQQVGILPSPRAMKIVGMSAFADPAISGADLKFLLQNAGFIFVVGDKEYWRGPMWMLPGGGGAVGTGTDLNTNGQGLAYNRFKLEQPVIVPSLQNFNITLKSPLVTGALTAQRSLTYVFWSSESRGVQ